MILELGFYSSKGKNRLSKRKEITKNARLFLYFGYIDSLRCNKLIIKIFLPKNELNMVIRHKAVRNNPQWKSSKALSEHRFITLVKSYSETHEILFGESMVERQTNPTGATSGSDRVSRGGSWGNSPQSCRVAYRDYNTPDFRYDDLGFRLARAVSF
jgi:hypothetical protein